MITESKLRDNKHIRRKRKYAAMKLPATKYDSCNSLQNVASHRCPDLNRPEPQPKGNDANPTRFALAWPTRDELDVEALHRCLS
jgi:hypothetical protein